MKNTRDFKGIWIERRIWLSKELTLQEKVFFVEICSLDNQNGCFATNEYFSDFFGISKTRVSRVINSLVKKGFLKSKIIYEEGSKQIKHRVLSESTRPYGTKVQDPIVGKCIDNNTVNNTINNKENTKDFLDPRQTSIIEQIKDSERESKKVPQKKVNFSEDVENCFLACLRSFSEDLHPSTPKSIFNWKEAIEKCNRIDGVPFDTIVFVVTEIRKDSFWSKNFLSLPKIRRKNSDQVSYFTVFKENIKKPEKEIKSKAVNVLSNLEMAIKIQKDKNS